MAFYVHDGRIYPRCRPVSFTMMKSESLRSRVSNRNVGSVTALHRHDDELRHNFPDAYPYRQHQFNAPSTLHQRQSHEQLYHSRNKTSVTSQPSHGGVTINKKGSAANEIRYPDFDQWLQTAGNIGYVTSVMLSRSKSESTLSEMSDMTNTRRKIFSGLKKSNRKSSRLNYQDLGKKELRDGIRQHHVALLRWTQLVGQLSQKLSSAFCEFSKKLEDTTAELRYETEKTNKMFRSENVKTGKPTFILGRTLDKIWLTVLDNISDQARIFNDLSKTLNNDFSPSFTELIDHHQKFIGQIYSFECGLEQLLTDYRQTTQKAGETAELGKSLALTPADPKQIPRTGLGSLTFALNSQNDYVLNLHNYNTMVSQYENSLMPILVEEMEEASTDLMTYGVKFLEAITQILGKRYGELKGRMEVVEYTCRYQTKARSDISAYVKGFVDNYNSSHGRSISVMHLPPSFVPIPVTPKNHILAVLDNEQKLEDTADLIGEEIEEMTQLRRSKQAELEKLEEKYNQCLSNINAMASLGNGATDPTAAAGGKTAAAAKGMKEALPSFSTVTLALKENIADSKRTVVLANAKLNSLKHQMDLLSAARGQSSGVDDGYRASSDRSRAMTHSGKAPARKAGGIKRSLTQWFSFLTVSNHEQSAGLSKRNADSASAITPVNPEIGSDEDAETVTTAQRPQHLELEEHGVTDRRSSSGAGGAGGGGNSGGNNGGVIIGKPPTQPQRPSPVGANAPQKGGRLVDGSYYVATYENSSVGEANLADEDEVETKEKATLLQGFKKTIDKIRRIASEDHPSAMPKARRHANRAQSHEPDPVYALLKCASQLSTANLHVHADSCQCDECPARRIVSGLSPSLLPAELLFRLPGVNRAVVPNTQHQETSPTHQTPSQQPHQQGASSSMLAVEHPAWTLGTPRNRLSSNSASSTSPSSAVVQPQQSSSQRSSLIMQPGSQSSTLGPNNFPNNQPNQSVANLRR